jgi:DNA-binding transcriptional LysR family regulator
VDLNEIYVFAQVVRAGSFVRAARQLGMPKSTVSRKVVDLEARLGARLLERTTRTLRLTDTGRVYFAHAERILIELEEADAAVTQLQAEPRGPLRVSAPLNISQLGPIGERFLARYPEVQLEIACTDRIVDLIAEGFDLALRVGKLADSTLIARPLATMRNVLMASPGLLEQSGVPSAPEQLPSWPCIAFGGLAERAGWELLSATGRTASVRITPRFIVNDFDVLASAAISGLGIALLPAQRCAEDVRAGRLRRVLPEWSSIVRPLQAVYPSGRHLSRKMTAFLEHLSQSFSPPPWEVLPAA